LLEDLHGDYREGTSSPLLRAGTTLASAHPQVSSIAPSPGFALAVILRRQGALTPPMGGPGGWSVGSLARQSRERRARPGGRTARRSHSLARPYRCGSAVGLGRQRAKSRPWTDNAQTTSTSRAMMTRLQIG
jgi:hypothetical protein